MKKLTILLFTLLAFVVNTSVAQQVSVSEALSRATAFLQNQPSAHRAPANGNNTAANRQLSLAYTARHLTNDKTCFYVFNRGTDNGFIIMGGDAAAKEVLGYSTTGTFDIDHAPANFLWWLSQYQQDISSAIDYVELHPDALDKSVQNATATGKHKAAAERHDIQPLLTTKWSQDHPYSDAINAAFNAQTGSTGDANIVTGCVATAMAQVLNYHQWPVQGKGQHSYTNELPVLEKSFTPSADFGATTYDWANMIDVYDDKATAAQKNAVAQLMYHCGVSVDMVYTNNMSGAVGQAIPYALCTYFGYDRSMRNESRAVYADNVWEDMVYRELAANRPVLYGGDAQTVGHQFVCDGYDAALGFFSFNWGWAGFSDGYYALTGSHALQPDGSGIGGGGNGAAYTNNQYIITNLMRDNGGEETIHFAQMDLSNFKRPNAMYLEYDSEVYDKSLTHRHAESSYKRLALYTTMINISATYSGGMTGIKATNRNTGKVTYFSGQYHEIPIGFYYTEPAANTFNVNLLTDDGIYDLRPVIHPIGSDKWEELDILTKETIPSVIITNANPVSPLSLSFSVPGNQLQVEHTMQITSDELYTGNVIYTSSNPAVATVSADGIITAVGKGTATITVTADDMVVDGTAIFAGTQQEITITVTQAIKQVPEVSISATTLGMGNTAAITVSGYSGTVTCSSSNPAVASVSGTTVTAEAAGTTTITVSAPETASNMAINETFVVNVTNDNLFLTRQPCFSNGNNPYSDDMNLSLSIRNNITETKETWVYLTLYALDASNNEILLTKYSSGLTWNLSAHNTRETSFDIRNAFYNISFEADKKYRIKFHSDSKGRNPYNIPYTDFTYRDRLQLSHTIDESGIGTLILPFNAQLPAYWKAYECAGLDGSALILAESHVLKRNVPYIIIGAPATTTFTGPEAIDNEPLLFGDYALKGTFLSTYTFKAGDYVMQNQNDKVAFYRYTSGNSSATPYHAFVQLSADNASKYAVVTLPGTGSDIITDIQPSAISVQHPSAIYSVDGTRRSTLRQGLNILVDRQGRIRKMIAR